MALCPFYPALYYADTSRDKALILSSGSLIIGIVHVQNIFPAAQTLVNSSIRQSAQRGAVPSWAAIDYANRTLNPAHDRILLIGETRAFWLHVPYIAPSAYNGPQPDHIFGNDSSSTDWLRSLSQLGVTHLLVSNSEIERWHKRYGHLNLTVTQTDKLNHWLQTLTPVFNDGRGNVVLMVH